MSEEMSSAEWKQLFIQTTAAMYGQLIHLHAKINADRRYTPEQMERDTAQWLGPFMQGSGLFALPEFREELKRQGLDPDAWPDAE